MYRNSRFIFRLCSVAQFFVFVSVKAQPFVHRYFTEASIGNLQYQKSTQPSLANFYFSAIDAKAVGMALQISGGHFVTERSALLVGLGVNAYKVAQSEYDVVNGYLLLESVEKTFALSFAPGFRLYSNMFGNRTRFFVQAVGGINAVLNNQVYLTLYTQRGTQHNSYTFSSNNLRYLLSGGAGCNVMITERAGLTCLLSVDYVRGKNSGSLVGVLPNNLPYSLTQSSKLFSLNWKLGFITLLGR